MYVIPTQLGGRVRRVLDRSWTTRKELTALLCEHIEGSYAASELLNLVLMQCNKGRPKDEKEEHNGICGHQ